MHHRRGLTLRVGRAADARPGESGHGKIALGLTVWLLLVSVLHAEGYEQRQGNAMVRLKAGSVEAGKVKVRLADEIVLTVTIEGEAPLHFDKSDEAILQEQLKAFRGAGVWNRCEGETSRTPPDSPRRWEQTFHLDPLKDGEIKLQLVSLSYTEGPGKKPRQVTWEPIRIVIATEIAEADLKELRDITGLEELPPVRSWWLPWLIGLGVVLVGVGLVVGGWELKRRLAAPAPPPTPHEWALRELGRIDAQTLPAEHYHTQLSDVLRRYFELRFDLKASRQTTAEFLQTVQSLPALTPPQRERLREFLERCDLVKFARAEPAPDECRTTAALARALVEETAAVAPNTPPATGR